MNLKDEISFELYESDRPIIFHGMVQYQDRRSVTIYPVKMRGDRERIIKEIRDVTGKKNVMFSTDEDLDY